MSEQNAGAVAKLNATEGPILKAERRGIKAAEDNVCRIIRGESPAMAASDCDQVAASIADHDMKLTERFLEHFPFGISGGRVYRCGCGLDVRRRYAVPWREHVKAALGGAGDYADFVVKQSVAKAEGKVTP